MRMFVLLMMAMSIFMSCSLHDDDRESASLPNLHGQVVVMEVRYADVKQNGDRMEIAIRARNVSGTRYTKPFNFSMRFDGEPGFEYWLRYPYDLMPKEQARHIYMIHASDSPESARLIELMLQYDEPSEFYISHQPLHIN